MKKYHSLRPKAGLSLRLYPLTAYILVFLAVPGPVHALNVRQEHIYSDGILVSRPNADDIHIIKILANNNINSIEDYARWLHHNIQYKKDGMRDSWENPKVTLQRKYGDCEDFAFLTEAVLKIWGYETRVLAVHTPGKGGHAVCLFKKNNEYYLFDNARLLKTNGSSINKIAQSLLKRSHFDYLLQLDFQTHSWKIVYHNT